MRLYSNFNNMGSFNLGIIFIYNTSKLKYYTYYVSCTSCNLSIVYFSTGFLNDQLHKSLYLPVYLFKIFNTTVLFLK